MLLHNDVVTDGEPKPSSFSGGLGCEERIEHFFLHVRRNAAAVVPDGYLNMIAQIPGRGSKSWSVIAPVSVRPALGRCVKAIGDQIEQGSRDVLWEDIGLPCIWVQ